MVTVIGRAKSEAGDRRVYCRLVDGLNEKDSDRVGRSLYIIESLEEQGRRPKDFSLIAVHLEGFSRCIVAGPLCDDFIGLANRVIVDVKIRLSRNQGLLSCRLQEQLLMHSIVGHVSPCLMSRELYPQIHHFYIKDSPAKFLIVPKDSSLLCTLTWQTTILLLNSNRSGV